MDHYSDCLDSVEQLKGAWSKVLIDYKLTRPDRATDVSDVPGTAFLWANSDFPFWNCITWTDVETDRKATQKKLARAVAYMKGKRPGFLWIFEDLLLPEARRSLETDAKSAGLQFGLTMYGMAGEFMPISRPSHPDLEFVRVDSEYLLKAYADINSDAYGMPIESGREGLMGSALWKSKMYAYLALRNGRPVAAAATCANNGSLFLALVATIPEAQRKGYGEAIVRKALHEGANATGLTRATLHATQAGAPVYERIGYQKVATIQAYTLPA